MKQWFSQTNKHKNKLYKEVGICTLHNYQLINSMQSSYRSSASHKIPHSLWNPEVCYRVSSSPPRVPALSQLNSVIMQTTLYCRLNCWTSEQLNNVQWQLWGNSYARNQQSTNIPHATTNYQHKTQTITTFHHCLNNANCKLLLTLTPVTSMSLRQFSAVSCVHRCPSTHQSHGKLDETHCVHELYVLQSKNVKFVVTKSGPDVIRTDSLAVKWSATKTWLLFKFTDFSTIYFTIF